MITAKKYLEVTDVRVTGGFCLKVQFNDGTTRDVDLSVLMEAAPPVFLPLKDAKAFAKISLNSVGGIAWECGADLSAEYLRRYQ